MDLNEAQRHEATGLMAFQKVRKNKPEFFPSTRLFSCFKREIRIKIVTMVYKTFRYFTGVIDGFVVFYCRRLGTVALTANKRIGRLTRGCAESEGELIP